MPVNGRATWQELLTEIARRQGEIDVATNTFPTGIPGSPNVPFDVFADIENLLWECSCAALRELTFDELMNVGDKGVKQLTGASPLLIPNNAVGIITWTVGDKGDIELVPASFLAEGASTRIACHSFLSGQIEFIGAATGEFYLLVEPPLSDWQADNVILPPAYDNSRIDEVCSLLEVRDFLPTGRLG